MKESDKIRKKEMRDNLDDDKREQIRDNDKNKKYQHKEVKDERKLVFDNVHRCSMVNPFILATPAFKIIEKHFKSTIPKLLLTSVMYVRNLNFERMFLN